MNQNQTLAIFLLLCHLILAQQKEHQIPDSLQNKSYDYLDDKAYTLKKDTSKAIVYLNAYLAKAKKEQNWKEIVNGYRNLSNQTSDKLTLIYADSAIYAAKKTNNNTVIGSAYLSKGISYYALKQHNYALDNYIIANSYLANSSDKYLIHKLKYHIALVKYYLGYYDESISLLKQCISYFKNDNPQPYLNSMHFLGVCYNRIGEYGLCDETNILGLAECKKLKITEMEVYFIHSQGINDYFKLNYTSSIKNIESSIEGLKEKNDFGNESVGYFYIGKSYWKMEKYEKALPYFKKVDQLFISKGYLRPDIREVYELLIDYYKTKDNPKLQLYYVDQLLKADRILNETFHYLVGKINKEYNTQELLIEKENLKKELFIKNHKYSVLIGFTSLLFSGFLFINYRNFRNKKFYKKRFEELMLEINNSKNKIRTKEKNQKPAMPSINNDTGEIILKLLEKFENEKKYLERDWKLSGLATFFNHNPTYLSAIIHQYKEKSFNRYINDLKIEYIISLLSSNKLIRNYTNKALAEEAGFSSTERFAKAFKIKTGMPTAYFIEQIKKENTNANL
jgi:AraC-like DNA-binding protein